MSGYSFFSFSIVSFPIFSHWGIRLQLLLSGYAPISKQLPYEWYDTPNIRVITNDFRKFIRKVGCNILKEAPIDTHSEDRHGRVIKFLPNLRDKLRHFSDIDPVRTTMAAPAIRKLNPDVAIQ